MELNEQTAVAYFKEKAPKQIRGEGIWNMKVFEHVKGPKVFVFNNEYAVYMITPEPLNCLMRNQNYKARISGRKLTKNQFLDEFLDTRYYRLIESRLPA